jgi:hypothetical protein
METKVSNLSVKELESLVAKIVRETIEDTLEDYLAKSSKEYMSSIREAREEYSSGRTKKLEEILD